MSTSRSALDTITAFDGIDYRSWAEKMKSYLLHQGVWRLVSGDIPRPVIADFTTTVSTPGATATAPPVLATTVDQPGFRKEEKTWIRDDDVALGAIRLKVSEAIRRHIKDATSSKDAWKSLKDAYSKVSPAITFGDFKAAATYKLSGRDPVPEIERLGSLFARLADSNFDVPDLMQAMILANAIPDAWSSLSTALFQVYDADDFTYKAVAESIISEYRRKYAIGSTRASNEQARKISGTKRKGQDPKWEKQTAVT